MAIKMNKEDYDYFMEHHKDERKLVTEDEVRKVIKNVNDRITICENRHKVTDPMLVINMHQFARDMILSLTQDDYYVGIIEPLVEKNGHMHIPTTPKAIKAITDLINESIDPQEDLDVINMITLGTVRNIMRAEDEIDDDPQQYMDCTSSYPNVIDFKRTIPFNRTYKFDETWKA